MQVKYSTPLTLVNSGTKVLPNLTLTGSKVLLIAVKAANFDTRRSFPIGVTVLCSLASPARAVVRLLMRLIQVK